MRFLIFLLLIPGFLWSAPVELAPELQSPLHLLNNGQLLEALSSLKEMESTHLDSRQYLFLKAMAKWKIAWISTYSPADLQEIRALLDRVQELCLPALNEDLEARFFYAACIGLRAQISATEGNWWQTAKLGKKMKEEALLIVGKDPDFYPAYYMLGSYNYFADALPSYLKFLRVFVFLPSGNRKEGLKQLTTSYEKGGITEDEAGRTLALIYTYYEQNFDEGKKLTEKILERYPLSYDTALYRGINLYYRREWDDAVKSLELLRSEIIAYSAKHENSGNIVSAYRPMEREIRYWIARAKYQQGHVAEAQEIFLDLANPPIHQPYWLMRGVYLSLAQIDYKNQQQGRADGYVHRILDWQDVKDAHEKAKKLRKKKGNVDTFDIDFL